MAISNELEKLPPKHNARINPDLCVERSEIKIQRLENRIGSMDMEDKIKFIYGE
jgi:hypothetical protein